MAVFNAPIIDNTIAAYARIEKITTTDKNKLSIHFYYNDDNMFVSKTYVFAKVLQYGESIWPGVDYRPYIVENIDITDDISGNDIVITLPDTVNVSAPFQVALALAPIAGESYLSTRVDKIQPGLTAMTWNISEWLNYIGNNDWTVAWSGSVLKYLIAPPTFTLWGGLTQREVEYPTSVAESKTALQANTTNVFDVHDTYYRIKGTLSFDDIKEDDTLAWYQLKLFKANEQLTSEDIIDWGAPWASTDKRQFLDYLWDRSRRNFAYTFKEYLIADLIQKLDIRLVGIYKTRKGYVGEFDYRLQYNPSDDQPIETSTDLLATVDHEKGIVQLKAPTPEVLVSEVGEYGTVLWNRKKHTEPQWETFYEQQHRPFITETCFIDTTLEAGVLYDYRAVFLDSEGVVQGIQELTTPIMLLTEDMFLVTKEAVLKVQYNPTVTSYKYNIAEAVTPTLGGIYPFVRRNGAQRYRTFQIGGLLSYHSEAISNIWKYAIGPDSSGASYNELTSTVDTAQSLFTIDAATQSYINSLASSYERERIYEKIFRDKILTFLHKDQVILFKSLTEGNIFVRLSNIQLTSQQQLDRNVYSFTATATEIAAATADNYRKYFSEGILPTDSTYSIITTYLRDRNATNETVDVLVDEDITEPANAATVGVIEEIYTATPTSIDLWGLSYDPSTPGALPMLNTQATGQYTTTYTDRDLELVHEEIEFIG